MYKDAKCTFKGVQQKYLLNFQILDTPSLTVLIDLHVHLHYVD